MTTVKVSKCGGSIISIECVGHTGYAEHGEDIVCSAVSAITQTALLGLLQVAKVDVSFEVDEKRGYLKMTLPQLEGDKRIQADAITDTLVVGINDLMKGYPKFINMEVDNDVY